MDITVRSYLTAGVALAGAGVIAIAPTVAPPPPTVAAAAPLTSIAVDLSAAVNPIQAWVNVFTGAAENLGGLGSAWLQDPFPLLRQALINGLGYGGTLVSAVGGAVDGALQYLDFSNEFSLWSQLGDAVEQLFQGEIAAAFNSLTDALVTGPIFNIGFPIFTSGLLDVPAKITQNVANLVKTLFNLETMLPLVLGAVAPVMGSLAATGETLQAAFDSLMEGKLIDSVINLINLPAVVIGAALNGFTKFDGTWMPGIFSFSEDPFQGGLLQALFVTLPKALAAAITPEAVPESAARVAADEVSDPEVGGGTMFALTNVQTEDAAAGTETVTESETAAPVPTAPEEPAAAIVDTPEEDAAEETDPTTDDGTGAEDTTVPDPEETDEDTGAEDELTDETETDTDDTDTDTDTDTDDGNDAGDAPSGAAGDGADSGGSDSGDE